MCWIRLDNLFYFMFDRHWMEKVDLETRAAWVCEKIKKEVIKPGLT